MKGHDAIVALRRDRLKPAAVFVSDQPGAHIEIQPADIPETLDLRFLVGLLVHVSVDDTPKGHRISQACAAASARCITAYHRPGERFAHLITDTQENKEWRF
mgnify:CR=1 FL=1